MSKKSTRAVALVLVAVMIVALVASMIAPYVSYRDLHTRAARADGHGPSALCLRRLSPVDRPIIAFIGGREAA